jgi:hypothetical protein
MMKHEFGSAESLSEKLDREVGEGGVTRWISLGTHRKYDVPYCYSTSFVAVAGVMLMLILSWKEGSARFDGGVIDGVEEISRQGRWEM